MTPRVEFTPGGKPIEHGGAGTAYSHYGCRCDECTDANRRRCRRRVLERATETPPEHGLSGYINWNCRCDVCRAAGSVANRVQYERRQASA